MSMGGALTSEVTPTKPKIPSAIASAGSVLHAIDFMCSAIVLPTRLGASTVVSEIGLILSPK